MNTETLRITWKYIRWAGQGRTPKTYCHYVAENENHKHKLKVFEGSNLFNLLKTTRIYKNCDKADYELFVEGVYDKGQLLYVTNFKRI